MVSRAEKPDFVSERSDLGSVRPTFGLERPDFGSERPNLGLGGGGDGWTDGNRRKLPYVES